MMTSRPIDLLPLPQRLALAYAPRKSQSELLAFFALDARLGQAVAQASEPLMGQVRLAWWRDQLGLSPAQRARGEAAVQALDALEGIERDLLRLADGWECLLGERLDRDAVEQFASARAEALVGLSGLLDTLDSPDQIRRCARQWALADLAAGLSSKDERDLVLQIAHEPGLVTPKLSRELRPLAILSQLSRISIDGRTCELISGPFSLYTVFRFGLFGR